MAVDMFLSLEGVTGESRDKTHKDKMEILSWSWGMTQSGTAHRGGGMGGGKASVQDISVVKYVDKASPEIWKRCFSGKHFEKGQLIIRKAGDTPLEYMVYDLTHILITSASTGGSGGEDALTENLSLNFRDVKFVYTEQDESTGGAKSGKPEMTLKIAENTHE